MVQRHWEEENPPTSPHLINSSWLRFLLSLPAVCFQSKCSTWADSKNICKCVSQSAWDYVITSDYICNQNLCVHFLLSLYIDRSAHTHTHRLGCTFANDIATIIAPLEPLIHWVSPGVSEATFISLSWSWARDLFHSTQIQSRKIH